MSSHDRDERLAEQRLRDWWWVVRRALFSVAAVVLRGSLS
jgi:hypothetical protein